MNTLLLSSIILFVLSIISFFIKNGIRQLTLKQIIQLSGRRIGRSKLGYSTICSTFSDILLLFSVISLIIMHSDNFPPLILFFGGLFIIFLQKIIILFLQKIISICIRV